MTTFGMDRHTWAYLRSEPDFHEMLAKKGMKESDFILDENGAPTYDPTRGASSASYPTAWARILDPLV